MEFDIGIVTILMFGSLFTLLAIGVHVAFSLLIVGVVFTILLWGPERIDIVPLSMFGSMRSQVFIAIPLFILMGNILHHTGIADELFTAFYMWTARVKGGLAMGVVGAGAILGAICGTSEAGTITVGIMALPAMIKRGYNKSIAVGCVAAGGLLGILIPPSIVGILYAALSGVSLGRLYFASFLPGILLAVLYILYIGVRAYVQPELCPIVAKEDSPKWRERIASSKAFLVPLGIIVMVLGGIYSGAITPSEAGGVGAFAALAVAVIRGRLGLINLWSALKETFKLLGMIAWMIMCVTVFTNVYNALGAPEIITEVIEFFPGGGMTVIILMQVSIFLFGTVMDDFALMFLVTPIYVPIVTHLGYDPVWFGVLILVNMQCAWITPPYGFNLFYVRAIAPPEIRTIDIWVSVIPFVLLQIVCLVIIMVFPQIALWLPSVIIG